ncbi:IclR family transcriptional regulator, partial [Streptomyces sp. FT05W]
EAARAAAAVTAALVRAGAPPRLPPVLHY